MGITLVGYTPLPVILSGKGGSLWSRRISPLVRSGTDDFTCKYLVKYSLYPFDSLRSLRVTAVGRVFSIKVPEEDSHHSGVMYGLFHFQKPNEDSHPERQSSSANHPSFHSASLELFARDLLRNQRFRLGLRMGITMVGPTLSPSS